MQNAWGAQCGVLVLAVITVWLLYNGLMALRVRTMIARQLGARAPRELWPMATEEERWRWYHRCYVMSMVGFLIVAVFSGR